MSRTKFKGFFWVLHHIIRHIMWVHRPHLIFIRFKMSRTKFKGFVWVLHHIVRHIMWVRRPHLIFLCFKMSRTKLKGFKPNSVWELHHIICHIMWVRRPHFIFLRVHFAQNGTTHIVYFLAPGHPGAVTGTCLAREEHGLTRVQLLKPDLPDVMMPDDVWTFDVTAPEVRRGRGWLGGGYTSVVLCCPSCCQSRI